MRTKQEEESDKRKKTNAATPLILVDLFDNEYSLFTWNT